VNAPTSILDASALLAYMHGEPGAQQVTLALAARAWISTVNWAEVLSTLAVLGQPPEVVRARLVSLRVLDDMLLLHNFDEKLAEEVARLRPLTKTFGLSLGDRACLALAILRGLPVLTTDREWRALRLGIDVRVIR